MGAGNRFQLFSVRHFGDSGRTNNSKTRLPG